MYLQGSVFCGCVTGLSPEPLVSATHAESALESRPSGPPREGRIPGKTWRKADQRRLTATRVTAATAEMTVSAAPLESELSVGAAAIGAGVKTAPHSTMAQAKRSQVKAGGGPPSQTATLTLAVSPWGRSTSTANSTEPRHQSPRSTYCPEGVFVEVRNPSQPSYFTYATVRAGEIGAFATSLKVDRGSDSGARWFRARWRVPLGRPRVDVVWPNDRPLACEVARIQARWPTRMAACGMCGTRENPRRSSRSRS